MQAGSVGDFFLHVLIARLLRNLPPIRNSLRSLLIEGRDPNKRPPLHASMIGGLLLGSL